MSVNLTAGTFNAGTQAVLVGAGNDGNFFGNTFFDLNGGANGDQFIYTSAGNYCGISACSPTAQTTWTLTGLNFGTPLLGFEILQQDVAPITIDFVTADSVQFHYNDVDIHDGVNVVGRFITAAVPEPATWGMMILGFGVMGAALRRRRQQVRVTYA